MEPHVCQMSSMQLALDGIINKRFKHGIQRQSLFFLKSFDLPCPSSESRSDGQDNMFDYLYFLDHWASCWNAKISGHRRKEYWSGRLQTSWGDHKIENWSFFSTEDDDKGNENNEIRETRSYHNLYNTTCVLDINPILGRYSKSVDRKESPVVEHLIVI
uniref:Uncharacterized protein n=1 Tax=Salix viminalis TaxID=40686 RepID=A0A6N2N5G8_SALVM